MQRSLLVLAGLVVFSIVASVQAPVAATADHRQAPSVVLDAQAPEVLDLVTSPGLPGIMAAVIRPRYSSILVYSLNGGETWTSVPSLPEGMFPDQIMIAPRADPEAPVRLVVASWRSIARSGDLGLTWAREELDNPIGSITVSLVEAQRLYLTTARNCGEDFCITYSTLYTSRDAGETWQQSGRSGPEGYFSDITPSPIVADRLYVRHGGGATYWIRLDDRGSDSNLEYPVDNLALDGQDPARLYGMKIGIGRKSIDGGDSWSDWTVQPCEQLLYNNVVADPEVGGLLFVQCVEGLSRSRDGGATWQRVADQPGRFLQPDYGMPGRWLWMRDDGLFASTDQGTTWQLLSTRLGAPTLLFLPLLVQEQ